MKLKKPLFLLILLALCGCTEEVAEELKNSASSVAQTSSPLSVGSIRLKHDMSDELSYYMHKGGDAEAPCKLEEPSQGFLASQYSKASSDHVLDCVLEVQELDLYHNGAKFTFEGDANMCEYYVYRPFRFIEKPMGNTRKTVYEAVCEENTCDPANICDTKWEDYDGSGDTSGLGGTNLTGTNLSCKFNYPDRNCDAGSITTFTFLVENAKGDFDNDPSTEDTCPLVPVTSMTLNDTTVETCGGNHANCLGGPAVDLLGTDFIGEIFDNASLSAFESSFEVEAPFNRLTDNRYVGNYSRAIVNSCSNTAPVLSASNWSTTFNGKDIENLGKEDLSAAIDYRYNSSYTLPFDAAGKEASISGEEVDYISFAENPFRSFYSTIPYYQFSCLDAAFDVKAQIRLFIREWDRKYPAGNDRFAWLTDHDTATPLMDTNPTDTNIDLETWNNVKDWDDFFEEASVWDPGSCYATNPLNHFTESIFPGKL